MGVLTPWKSAKTAKQNMSFFFLFQPIRQQGWGGSCPPRKRRAGEAWGEAVQGGSLGVTLGSGPQGEVLGPARGGAAAPPRYRPAWPTCSHLAVSCRPAGIVGHSWEGPSFVGTRAVNSTKEPVPSRLCWGTGRLRRLDRLRVERPPLPLPHGQ